MKTEQVHRSRPQRTAAPEVQESSGRAKTVREQAEANKAELDALLDEIDEVLEDNAAEFVQGYIQAGGE